MPPRIRIPRVLPGSFVVQRGGGSAPVLPFLAPALQTSTALPLRLSPMAARRSVSILSNLSDNPSAYNKRIRRGRGPSSGKGKTSGRGHKGQRQHGGVPAGFQGGQTPLHIVHGKRGFVNVHTPDIQTVPISRIVSWIAQGRIDGTKPITVRELALSGCVTRIRDGVKLLASSRSHDLSVDEVGPLAQPLQIVVSRASKQAIAAVEAAGGNVLTRYYTRFAIRKIIDGDMDPMFSLQSQLPDGSTARSKQAAALEESEGQAEEKVEQRPSKYAYRLPDATSRRDIQYYRDPSHRGYLAYQLAEGDNPSLFFKAPEEYEKYAKLGAKKRRAKKAKETQLLW